MRSNALACAALVTVLCALVAPADAQTTYVVDWDGTGDYLTIQEALDVAADGDTVMVMPSTGSPAGAYVENIVFPGRGITLTSTDPMDPGVVVETIIDGGGVDSVVDFSSDFVTLAKITGFTLRNGSAVAGGGINVVNCGPAIECCVIAGNTADEGGGIRVWNGSPWIADCTITQNTAYDAGGGIRGMGFTVGAETVGIVGGSISQNIVDADWAIGGGIACDTIDLSIQGCSISENTAGLSGASGAHGGGIYASDADVFVQGGGVSNNTAQGAQAYGGGVFALASTVHLDHGSVSGNDVLAVDFCAGGGVAADWGSSVRMDYTNVTGNTVVGGWGTYDGGGGVYCGYSELEIVGGTVADNYADQSGGGILSYDSPSTTLHCVTVAGNTSAGGAGITCIGGTFDARSCMITDNVAGVDGGGVYIEDAVGTIQACTLAMNEASTLYGAGGSVASFSATLTIDNSIMWGGVGVFGPELFVDRWDPNDASQADVSYCDITGGQAAVYVGTGSTLNWLAGNIDVDPAFADADGTDDDPNTWDDNDYHLAVGSPCLNAGDPAFVPVGNETDIDAQVRVQKCVIDMGADELRVYGSPTGDADEDGDADVLDFVAIQRCCGETIEWECLTTFDFDGSCLIDGDDFVSFEAAFSGPGT